jgi:hypothetical protein
MSDSWPLATDADEPPAMTAEHAASRPAAPGPSGPSAATGPFETLFQESPTASEIAARLDEDHLPETNGRMTICRCCGAGTDPAGTRHAPPGQRLLARHGEWLNARRHAAIRRVRTPALLER